MQTLVLGPTSIQSLKIDGSDINWIRPTTGAVALGGSLISEANAKLPIGTPKRLLVTDGYDATYSWGTTQERIIVDGNKVKWRVRIDNTSKSTLNLTDVTFFGLASPPESFTNNAGSGLKTGLGALLGSWPDRTDVAAGKLAIVLEQGVGIIQTVNRNNGSYPIRLILDSPEVAPGESRVFEMSIRFGAPTDTIETLAPDALSRTRTKKPFNVNWSDRRAIGRAFLSSAGAHNATNPQGWFSNDYKVDTTTDEGKAVFATRMLVLAEKIAARNTANDGQGVILWDIEGQRYGHPISYLGLPLIRDLDNKVVGVSLPPEIAQKVTYKGIEKPLIDHIFAIVSTTGRTGLTLRPTNALTSAFGQPVYPSHYYEKDWAQTLIDKINYAKSRWGCTLFYIDSNDDDAIGWKKVHEACPDVLLIPEQDSTFLYASTMPYRATEILAEYEPLSLARQIYPDCAGVLAVGAKNLKGTAAERVLRELKRGAIAFYVAQFDDNSINTPLKALYAQSKVV